MYSFAPLSSIPSNLECFLITRSRKKSPTKWAFNLTIVLPEFVVLSQCTGADCWLLFFIFQRIFTAMFALWPRSVWPLLKWSGQSSGKMLCASVCFDQPFSWQAESKCALCGQTLRALLVGRVSSPLEIPVVLSRTAVVHLSVCSRVPICLYSLPPLLLSTSSFSGDYVSISREPSSLFAHCSNSLIR